MAYVVAVSGISGAGKTSVIERAAELLGGAIALHFDDYAAVSIYPADLGDWLERGANVDEWQTPRLAEAVRSARTGAGGVLFVEEPFGRLRREMAPLIDLAVHVDVPIDLLLARRLLRRIEEEGDAGELVANLRRDLTHHQALGHRLDALGSAAVKAAADVVVDGTKPVAEIAAAVAAEIRRRR